MNISHLYLLNRRSIHYRQLFQYLPDADDILFALVCSVAMNNFKNYILYSGFN